MNILHSAIVCLLALVFPLKAAFPEPPEAPRTATPFIYVIDYATGQERNPEYREHFEKAAPDLFHPGSDCRYLGRFGFGTGVLDSRHTPYETYRKEMKDYIDFLHEKGVRWITPYLCNQTISGNDTLRLGAWEVYDRWEDFAFLGLGEKPGDLLEWMQREPSGNLHYNYKRMCYLSRGMTAEDIRYAPCANHPDWRRMCDNEARLAAEMGFDGLFIDNCILHCYCIHCEARFQRYLRNKYTPEEFQAAFGLRDYSDLTLYKEGDHQFWARSHPDFIAWEEARQPREKWPVLFGTDEPPLTEVSIDNMGGGMLTGECAAFIAEKLLPSGVRPSFDAVRLANPALQTPKGRLAWAETKMFWADSIEEQLAEMRAAGQAVNPDFLLIPNWGVMRRINAMAGRSEDAKDMQRWTGGSRWQMYEEDHTTGLIAPGAVLDFDMQLRFAYANGVRAMLLPYNLPGEEIFDVALAETAASGGSVFVGRWDCPELQNRYRRFFHDHQDLYEGYESAAEVGLIHCYDQTHYLHLDHARAIHALNRWLCDQQIPFDHVIESQIDEAYLARYKVLILADVAFMSEEQAGALLRFAQRGGTLLLIGKNATHDLRARPRSVSPFDSAKNAQRSLERIVRFASLEEALPQDGIFLEPALQAAQSEDAVSLLAVAVPARYAELERIDREFWIKRYQQPSRLGEPILAALAGEAPSMDPHKASGLRHTVYRKRVGNTEQVTVHVVNKNIPLAVQESERHLQRVPLVRLRIPLHGQEPRAIQVFSPGEEPQTPPCDIAMGIACISLENLGAYTVVHAELAPAADR